MVTVLIWQFPHDLKPFPLCTFEQIILPKVSQFSITPRPFFFLFNNKVQDLTRLKYR